MRTRENRTDRLLDSGNVTVTRLLKTRKMFQLMEKYKFQFDSSVDPLESRNLFSRWGFNTEHKFIATNCRFEIVQDFS